MLAEDTGVDPAGVTPCMAVFKTACYAGSISSIVWQPCMDSHHNRMASEASILLLEHRVSIHPTEVTIPVPNALEAQMQPLHL